MQNKRQFELIKKKYHVFGCFVFITLLNIGVFFFFSFSPLVACYLLQPAASDLLVFEILQIGLGICGCKGSFLLCEGYERKLKRSTPKSWLGKFDLPLRFCRKIIWGRCMGKKVIFGPLTYTGKALIIFEHGDLRGDCAHCYLINSHKDVFFSPHFPSTLLL